MLYRTSERSGRRFTGINRELNSNKKLRELYETCDLPLCPILCLMEKYLKKRADKLFPIFVPLNGKVCGACNMELATSEISKINNGEIIECEFCRKLLYKA